MTTDIAKPATVRAGSEILVVVDAEIVSRVQETRVRLESVTAVTEENIELADEIASDAKSVIKAIESNRKRAKEIPLKTGKAIDRVAHDLAAPLAAGLQRIDLGIIAVKQARARALAEAEAARRKAEAERAAAEAELRRLEAEAKTVEDRQAVNDLRVEVRKEGAKAWAQAIIDEPAELPSVGAHERTTTVAEVFDLVAFPTVWNGVQLVDVRLKVAERLMKAGVTIPGARLVERKAPVRRG